MSIDFEIEQVLWWTPSEVRSASIPHRSAQVLRCIDDYPEGERYDRRCLKQIPQR